MATTTPNYSFQKPTVSGDSGVWGGYLNNNFTSLDSLLGGNTAITGIDINSGSIDGTTIGAAAASTGAFTTLSASGTFTFGGVALTATGTEINYLDGVTSNIQTQLDAGGVGDVTLNGVQTLTNKTLTSPVLGGITTTASGNLVVDPATQIVEVKGDGSSVEGQIKLNCHANSHGQTLKSQPHSANVTNTSLLPAGADSTLVSLVSTDTLTNKTLTSPRIGTYILDTNGLELINLTATASAVNEITLANAATGANPTITPSGGDTNVGLNITPKGTGELNVDASFLTGIFSDKVSAIGNTGTAQTINVGTAQVFTATLNGNCTFTLSGANSNSSRASSFTLILANDGTPSRTVAFAGGNFLYPGGSVSRTTTASAVDVWFFFTPDSGTTWYITIPMKDLS